MTTRLEELDIRAYADMLKDHLIVYQRASAEERRARDALMQIYYQTLSDYLHQPGTGDHRKIHLVLDSLDELLKRSKS